MKQEGRPLCYVIDIGTNSTRLMLAEERNGRVRSRYKLVRTVRTGEGSASTGRISPAAQQRVVSALAEFRKIFDAEHPELPVYAFATSAVRDASNREELIRAIRERTGFETEVICGEEEALLSFLGAAGEDGGVIDAGGGSTEFAVGEKGSLLWSGSYDIGIVRAKELFGPEADEKAAALAYEYARTLFLSIPEDMKNRSFFAVGGSATSLAAMLLEMERYDPSRIQGFRVTRKAAERMLDRLCCMSVEQRKALPGLPPARADVMPYGVAILLAAMDALGIDSYTASDEDNLEGYVRRMRRKEQE